MNKIIQRMTLKSAFSLVEMLLALLVASLLMAALAPVMTRRMTDNVTISGTGGAFIPKVYCAYVNNGSSPIKKETPEEGCIVPDNTYSANIIMASGGGGGGGAAEASNGILDYTLMPAYTGGNGASTAGGGSIQSVKFSRASHTMWIYLVGGGSGGGGANGRIDLAPNEDSCKMLGSGGIDTNGYSDYSTYDGKGLCITKFNQTGSGCISGYSNTYNDSYAQYPYTYSGRGRTICSKTAAYAICNQLANSTGQKWRLPKESDVASWTMENWKKMAFCETDAGKVGATLSYKLAYCLDAPVSLMGNVCCGRGHGIWLDHQPMSEPCYYGLGDLGHVGSGTLPTPSFCDVDSRSYSSVRCVLDDAYAYYTGGGGASGAFVKLKVPSAVLIKATEKGDAVLKTFAGNGGKGGNPKNATRGISGTNSYAEISDSNGNVIWRVTVPGALSGGEGAQEQNAGAGGQTAALNSCKYLDVTNPEYLTEKTINCSDLPDAVFSIGENGGNGNTGISYASAGHGARPAWGDGALQGSRIYPPDGTSTSSINGTDAVTAGGGGSGGNCNYAKGGTLTCGKGGDGAGGRIYATHRLSFQGAGGGGGAAGTVAHIKGVQVRPGDFFKIQAGNGGNGGSIGAKGLDGGNSYVELTRNETKIVRYEILGGGGGNPAIKGDPDTNTQPVAGIAGDGSKLANGTNIPNNEYFPKKANDTKGSDGIVSADYISAYGGNGGINPIISPLAQTDGVMNGKPCGGLNTNEIKIDENTKWECALDSISPLNLTRALNDISISDSLISNIIQNYAAGATGGGGGGWKNGNIPEASGGAKGMGGYVIIYFGDWPQNQTVPAP